MDKIKNQNSSFYRSNTPLLIKKKIIKPINKRDNNIFVYTHGYQKHHGNSEVCPLCLRIYKQNINNLNKILSSNKTDNINEKQSNGDGNGINRKNDNPNVNFMCYDFYETENKSKISKLDSLNETEFIFDKNKNKDEKTDIKNTKEITDNCENTSSKRKKIFSSFKNNF